MWRNLKKAQRREKIWRNKCNKNICEWKFSGVYWAIKKIRILRIFFPDESFPWRDKFYCKINKWWWWGRLNGITVRYFLRYVYHKHKYKYEKKKLIYVAKCVWARALVLLIWIYFGFTICWYTRLYYYGIGQK